MPHLRRAKLKPAHLYQCLVQAGLEKFPALQPYMHRPVPPTVQFFLAHIEMAEILDGQALLYARASLMITKAMRGIRRVIKTASRRIQANAPLVELEKKIMALESLESCNAAWDDLVQQEKELRASEWARQRASRVEAENAQRRLRYKTLHEPKRPPNWGEAARERRKSILKSNHALASLVLRGRKRKPSVSTDSRDDSVSDR